MNMIMEKIMATTKDTELYITCFRKNRTSITKFKYTVNLS